MAKKGSDWKKLGYDIDAKKMSWPTSSQSSRPSSVQLSGSESQGTENVVKPNPKVNPFWDAKPGRCCWKRRDWIGGG